MISFLNKYKLTIIGVFIGAIGGYVYYHIWGCTNGCPIKSSAWKMILYGAAMGGLLFNIVEDRFSASKKK